MATLAFYVFTGYNFRPKVHNPYFAIDNEEEEAAAEARECELRSPCKNMYIGTAKGEYYTISEHVVPFF